MNLDAEKGFFLGRRDSDGTIRLRVPTPVPRHAAAVEGRRIMHGRDGATDRVESIDVIGPTCLLFELPSLEYIHRRVRDTDLTLAPISLPSYTFDFGVGDLPVRATMSRIDRGRRCAPLTPGPPPAVNSSGDKYIRRINRTLRRSRATFFAQHREVQSLRSTPLQPHITFDVRPATFRHPQARFRADLPANTAGSNVHRPTSASH